LVGIDPNAVVTNSRESEEVDKYSEKFEEEEEDETATGDDA